MIYMTHEKHGVHIAPDEDEAKKCEANGWKRMEVNAPPVEPEKIEPAKRGRPRKAA